MDKNKLDDILKKHIKWLNNEADGEKADLRSADLRWGTSYISLITATLLISHLMEKLE